MSRQDKFLITVTVAGVPYGIWDKSTGGERDSDETKYRSGGQPNQVALGGPGTVSNVTAERRFLAERDMAVLKALMPLAGKTRATLTKQPLDDNYSPYGPPLTYSGVLKKVTPPEADSMSSSAALIALEISTDGTIA